MREGDIGMSDAPFVGGADNRKGNEERWDEFGSLAIM
jgi:hypothetical protein